MDSKEITLRDNERWCVGLEGRYACSSNGDIISYVRGRKTLKGGVMYDNKRKRTAYKLVCLYVDGKSVSKYVHRLVAEAFIPNPDNKPQVNHKSLDKLDNSVDNLEWCTSKENVDHAYESGAFIEGNKKRVAAKRELALGKIEDSGVEISRHFLSRLEDDDFVEARVPPEIRKTTMIKDSYKDIWTHVVRVLRDCEQDYTLHYIAKKYDLDQSYISLIRRGLRWKKQWKIYNKYKDNSYYMDYI